MLVDELLHVAHLVKVVGDLLSLSQLRLVLELAIGGGHDELSLLALKHIRGVGSIVGAQVGFTYQGHTKTNLEPDELK